MSDISIPGVTTSKYKTDELIQGLMKVERLPRDRAAEDLEGYKKQQGAWRDVNQQTSTLREVARSLYSFDNPFSEKTASSTDERAVTAEVTREAREQSFKVSVNQLAEADSFLSEPIAKNDKVPAGNYTFTVGDSAVSFQWKGGSYRDFINALNRRGTGVVQASLIQISPDTQSLLIESQKTGQKNRLSFSDDALSFAIEHKIVKKQDTGGIAADRESYTVQPKSNGAIGFSSAAKAKDGLTLAYTLKVEDLPEEAPDAVPPGPDTGDPGSLTWQGITIRNAPPETALTEEIPEVPATPVKDPAVLSLRSVRGIAIPLPEIPETSGETEVSLSLAEYGDVDGILLNNRNTSRVVTISDIRIVDPRAAGEYVPVNPVSVAQNSELKYEGIRISRDTNEIGDLIPGVTLNLHEATGKTETLKVEPDQERAKNSIIEFVAKYNRAMAELNILTQNKPEVITELEYLTPDEKKAEEEKLGMMMGDTTLNGVKNSMQRITSDAYKNGDSGLTMLAQLGISTRATAGAGVDTARLRGYLEIDEKKLDEALSKKMEQVKNLFGFDSDGDLIVDSGVAKQLDTALTPYTQTGGIFAMRTATLNTKIESTNKKIAQLDVQLADKEANLKAKYGQMEGTLGNLQSQSNAISNFSKQNSGGN